MVRTKLKDRILPDYTRTEELINSISHIVGGGLGVIVLLYCLVYSIIQRDGWKIIGSIIYGISFIQLYVFSSLYHGMRGGTAKKVMQIIDHCSIYFFIAGSYTPIMLSSMRSIYPAWAWSILGVVWGLTALAVTLTAIDLKKYSVLSMSCYIGMGWCIIVGIRQLMQVLAMPGVILLVAGGIVYTMGSILYGIGKKHRYVHCIFHFFVLLGSILQALCIALYVI